MTRKPLIVCGAAAALVTLGALAQPEQDRRAQAQADRLMAMDKNGDGKLSRDELPERLAERIFAGADTDADGLVTRNELVAFFVDANPQPAATRPATGATPTAADFDASMRQAGRAMRHLRGAAFTEDTRAADLAHVQSVQEALLSAKGSFGSVRMSDRATERFGDDATAYERALRLAMITALRTALDLEEAVGGGDAGAAAAGVERLRALQDEAHDLFMVED